MNPAVRLTLMAACGVTGMVGWSLVGVLVYSEVRFGQTHGPSGYVLAAMVLPVALASTWGMRRLLK